MPRIRRPVLVLTVFAAGTFGAGQVPRAVPQAAASRESASSWARTVADFITDSQLYRKVPKTEASRRFLPLVPGTSFDMQGGVANGRNPAAGVVYMSANFGHDSGGNLKFGEFFFVLAAHDKRGTHLYPRMLAELEKRLRKPTWNKTAEGQSRFWRKSGKSRFVVSLEFKDFASPDAVLATLGPFVIVSAAMEEGDSEDP